MTRRILTLVIIVLSMLVCLNCQKVDVESIELKTGPHLFLDDYLIAEQSFLNRTVNHPEKLPDPIIRGGKKYDDVWQPYMSVIRDDATGVFRIWYNTSREDLNTMRCHIGYMESEDGINWKRPHRVLEDPHEIQFGVSVIDRGESFDPSDQRYVFATFLKPGLRVSTSSNGLKWNLLSDKPVLLHNHDISSLHWDPIREQYFAIVSHRMTGFGDSGIPGVDDRRRIPHQSVSKNLLDWEDIWPAIQPKTGAAIEKGETQFYAMSGVITRGDLMIGLVKVLRDDLNATPGKNAKQMGDMNRKAAGIGYTVLAWTRDGITWHRDHEPFLDRDPVPGTFDHAMAWGDEQVIVDDEVYIYYGGYERGHKVERFKERHVGFASMPVDRYVSRDADFNGGYLITKPVTLDASSMTVNADIAGELSVRLLDVNKDPIDGFEWITLEGDATDHKIEWDKSLSSITGKAVRIEFKFKDAQLFGFNLK